MTTFSSGGGGGGGVSRGAAAVMISPNPKAVKHYPES